MQPEPLLRLLFLLKPVPDTLAMILPLMMLGAIAQGFTTLPHLFQVAAGRMATVVWINGGLIAPYAAVIIFAAMKAGVFGTAVAFAAFNTARLFAHWIVLLRIGSAKPIWRSNVGLVAVSTVGGIILAGVPRMIKISWPDDTLVAVLTFSILVVIAGLAMPHTCKRLSALYKS
jgi:hypothetical protein